MSTDILKLSKKSPFELGVNFIAKKSPKLAEAAVLGYVGYKSYGTVKQYYTNIKNKFLYEINFYENEDEDLYYTLLTWFYREAKKNSKIYKKLDTYIFYQYEDVVKDNGLTTSVSTLKKDFRPTLETAIKIKIYGYTVFVSLEDGKTKQNNNDLDSEVSLKALVSAVNNEKYISFKTYSLDGQRAIQKFLSNNEYRIKSNKTINQNSVNLYLNSRGGDWEYLGRGINRPIHTIFLKENQLENLIEDIRIFKQSRKKYQDLGIPYHRGYLLQGPPGTGKSSIGIAIGQYFDMRVHYLSLSAVFDDGALIKAFKATPQNSLILLEDIDIFNVVQSRENSDNQANENKSTGPTLSGLLNCLDGITAPNNCIIMMTTNYPEKIDKAILRSGRIDYIADVGYLDDYQLKNMVSYTLDKSAELPAIKSKIAPAEVVEIIKSNLYNKEKAIKEIKDLIELKNNNDEPNYRYLTNNAE